MTKTKENVEKKGNSLISSEKMKKYKVHNVLTASGKRKSVDNDDAVAKILRGLGSVDYNKIYKENKFFVSNWNSLNAGLKRLALGNMLRRRIRYNEDAFVDGVKLK